MLVTKITLEDTGQDILHLYVDRTGRVIEAAPFQNSIWVGAAIPVWDKDMVKVGKPCPIHKPPYIAFSHLIHKIESIEEVEYDGTGNRRQAHSPSTHENRD